MSTRLHELNWVELKERGLGSMSAAAAASGRSLTASTSPSHPRPLWLSVPLLLLCLSPSPSPSVVQPPSLLLISSHSLHYWYRTHLWIFPVSRELMTSPLSPSLCLIYLSAPALFFPSGQPADKVILHSANGTITLVLFFIACPGKLLQNCSSILQMNCLDNLMVYWSGGAGGAQADRWLRAGSQISGRNRFMWL